LGFFVARLELCINLTKDGLGYILGDLKKAFLSTTGVNVMITIFYDFRPFLAKKMACFILKNQFYDQFFA
jgi:hypothetical protein